MLARTLGCGGLLRRRHSAHGDESHTFSLGVESAAESVPETRARLALPDVPVIDRTGALAPLPPVLSDSCPRWIHPDCARCADRGQARGSDCTVHARRRAAARRPVLFALLDFAAALTGADFLAGVCGAQSAPCFSCTDARLTAHMLPAAPATSRRRQGSQSTPGLHGCHRRSLSRSSTHVHALAESAAAPPPADASSDTTTTTTTAANDCKKIGRAHV